MTFDPGILRPGGAAAAFQNSSPQAAICASAVTPGRSFPLLSRFPSLPLPPSTLFPAPHLPGAEFQSNSLGWRKAAPGTRTAAPATTSKHAWRTLLCCLPHARLRSVRNGPSPAQVAERVGCPFPGLQAHTEILRCPLHPSKPSCKTTKVTLASANLGARNGKKGHLTPDGFSKEGLEEGVASISSLASFEAEHQGPSLAD